MPRKERRLRTERNLQAAKDHILHISAESHHKMERERAQKNLQTAKALEAEKLKSGYRYIADPDGKTQRLVKTPRMAYQPQTISHDHTTPTN